MKNDLIAILVDSAGEIISIFFDGNDDGTIVITDSETIFDRIVDAFGFVSSFFK